MSAEMAPELTECLATFRRWLYLPEPGHLFVVLAAAVANLAPGDPVWLLVVGPPSAGKTEVVHPLVRMPWAHSTATLTEASLLSGTPKREVQAGAKGGLLREVGDFGVLVMKDFTSVLAENRDTQAQVLAALREVFDGSWTRCVGTDGGRTLSWQGKLGLIAGVTPTIDQHHAVIAQMGTRFVFYRLPTDDVDRVAHGALAHGGRETTMRGELADAVEKVLPGAPSDATLRELTTPEQDRLVRLAVFATTCRTGVERDPRTREILDVPQAEGPARFVLQLRLMLHGLETIGVPTPETWHLLAKLALDAMPASRLAVLRHLQQADVPLGTGELAAAVQLPTVTAKRSLEDLTLLGATTRTKVGTHETAPDHWTISTWTTDHWPPEAVPEIPGTTERRAVPEIPDGLYSPLTLSDFRDKPLSGAIGAARGRATPLPPLAELNGACQ